MRYRRRGAHVETYNLNHKAEIEIHTSRSIPQGLFPVHSCTSERLIHSDTARVLGRMVWITCLIHARPSRTRRL